MTILRTERLPKSVAQLSDGKGTSAPQIGHSSGSLSSIVTRQSEKARDRYRRLLREMRAGGGFLEHEYPRQNVLLVAERHFESERLARDSIRAVKHRVGQLQERDGYPRWHFEVLEGSCGVHSNIVAPLTMARAEQLLNWTFEGVAFGQFVHVQRVTDMRGLIGYGVKNPGYLGKELGQKHALGDGGGDKIRFSDSLRDELIGRGMIGERKRVYASRAIEKRAPVAAAEAPKPVLKLVVYNALAPTELQLSLLSEKPVTRLRDFAHGVMPPAVVHEVETRRKWLGLTQAALASAVGLSRPQLVNALQGRFGLSEWTVSRLRDFLLKGDKLAA